MSGLAGWAGPIAVWVAATLGGRGILVGLGLVRCRTGDWGNAFLLGFTLATTLMFAGAAAGIPVGLPLIVAAAAAVLAGGLLARRGRSLPPREAPPWTPAERLLAAGLLAGAVLLVEFALYFPVTAMDAHSYAGRALYLLHDRSLDLALYHWPGHRTSAESNLTYPPLMSLGFAVTHAFGGWQPKIVTAAFDLAWPLTLYGVLRSRVPRFAALAWTGFLALTPEVLSHASFALLNVPAMALILAEAAALGRFMAGGNRRFLVPAGVFAAGAAGIRPDAVAVHAALWLTALGVLASDRGARARLRASLPALTAVALAPLATWGAWSLYLRAVVGYTGAGPLGRGELIGLGGTLPMAARLLVHWPTFGATFLLWLATLPFLFRGSGPAVRFHRLAAPAVLLALVAVFSLLDRDFGGGAAEVLGSSFKRSFFYLVPLSGLAAAFTPPWSVLARRGQGIFHLDPLGEGRETVRGDAPGRERGGIPGDALGNRPPTG